MSNYIIKRILSMIPIILGITIISFAVINLAPGSFTDMMSMNPKITAEYKQSVEKMYSLDKPIYERYFMWLKGIFKGDMGRSFSDGRPVLEKVLKRLPITLMINILSMIFVFLIAIPLGVKSAIKENSLFDNISTVVVFVLFAIPGFWLALILMSFFCVKLGWLPVSGIVSLDFEYMGLFAKVFDIAKHLILPVIILSLPSVAGISRFIREKMIAQMKEDYVRTARAKGLKESVVVYKHALRNALLPVITILGLSIPRMISGSVILESIFSIPGMGRLMVTSVFGRDYNVIMCGLLFSCILTLIGNLIADIAYAYADPRVRK